MSYATVFNAVNYSSTVLNDHNNAASQRNRIKYREEFKQHYDRLNLNDSVKERIDQMIYAINKLISNTFLGILINDLQNLWKKKQEVGWIKSIKLLIKKKTTLKNISIQRLMICTLSIFMHSILLMGLISISGVLGVSLIAALTLPFILLFL
ncbi:uncharacterized protein ASCRUDRAFT_147000 [Ascoidea rubescens DSM 1968]|uniref:Uncharacterized protein n=1 Tax=Ascoidea rubescens DSM 1968 TaxID=1344418 RepID=A0A1D2VHP2_9ASCO|nr:hypothetical protein ASCRUDRAFT_147000 [Ascoidea rubescens DSM 1968]ODV61178.1 hypothetical protein ASCRUDRAFT_147000 [Ascoidea rubescens DSM 1968]